MLSYETALKLKNAGFKITKICGGVKEDNTPLTLGDDHEKVIWCETPSLEELIEACGDEFCYLRKRKDEWEVLRPVDMCAIADNTYYGSTPSEAVASLWLALQGKGGKV